MHQLNVNFWDSFLHWTASFILTILLFFAPFPYPASLLCIPALPLVFSSAKFICPNDMHPSGTVANNTFLTCANSEAFHNRIANCSANVTFIGNQINPPLAAVPLPQIRYAPPAATATNLTAMIAMTAVCTQPNATLRYTLDGSRPDESSPVLPSQGIILAWPGPDLAFNVRAFHPGMLASATQSTIVPRQSYLPRSQPGDFDGHLDNVTVTSGGIRVNGWAVDRTLPEGGVPPVTVQINVDQRPVLSVTANLSRPDLVKDHVAPNPQHGFDVTLPSTMTKSLLTGRHVIDAFISHSNACSRLCALVGSPLCINEGRVAAC